MQNLHSYDTTAQAMTEVALALSMAFFALLILALLSFQVPQKKHKLAQNPSSRVSDSEKIQLGNTAESSHSPEPSSREAEQVVFFYQGRFVDQQLKTFALNNFQHGQTNQTLVLAVPPSLTFSEMMVIKTKINHPNLSITLITEQWQTLLEKTL